ncbi:MAG: hypothetical protein IKM66_10275 [Clostridia bacterium]|nr:hypothetical protein [Clostridia bacterium]
MNGLSGNKKILISVVGFILVMAVGIGVLLVLSGSNEKQPDELPDVSSSVSTENFENVSAAVPETDFPEMNFIMDASEGEKIQAYISGNYYISAVMNADDVATEMKFAINGKDFYTTSDIEGMNLGIMFKNEKIYLINNTEKKYIDFDSIMTMLGGQTDFDMSEITAMTEVLDLSTYNFNDFEQTQVDFNGQTATCYKYYADEISIHFYFVEGELRQVDYGDADGVVTTTINVNEFSPTIPSDMLTLNGLRPSTIFDFFGQDMLQQLQ